jgi:AraC-like DNA-binding protein
MNYSGAGHFRGDTYQTIAFDGVTATETEYDYKFIDWHYHENPYFSLTIYGTCRDANKRETFDCGTDSLLFHNCQEPHYNTKTGGLSRGFQLELSQAWRAKYEVNLNALPKSAIVRHPHAKLLFYNIYKEAKLFDDTSNLTADALLLQIIGTMSGTATTAPATKPRWVQKADEILRDRFDQTLTLQELAVELNLHWVHLSRDFPRYFNCNFSEYVRKIRVEKSLGLLRKPGLSLTDIALLCGFADQSHFIRCFKSFHGLTPKKFRQIILAR